MKKHLIHGAVAGILAAIAGIIYLNIYKALFLVDFSMVLDAMAIAMSSIIGCVLIAIGYIILDKIKKPNFQGILNLIVMVLSFLSIIPVMTMKLPLVVEFPELFPGLVVPMHFFPAMIFFGVAPFFKKRNKAEISA